MKPVTISLGWPVQSLSPNARVHWTLKARATKAARHLAHWTALEAGAAKLNGKPVKMTVTFHRPDNRVRDDDNDISRFKAYRDGIADALNLNDSKLRPSYEWGPVAKGGRIVVTVTPVEAAE